MTNLRETPAPLTGGRRRRLPWREGTQTRYVPLLDPHPQGEEIEGLIRVPKKLALAEPHTNDYHKLVEKIRTDVGKWISWRRMRGWEIATKPIISKPFEPLVEDETTEVNPDEYHLRVTARFRRITPLYISLDEYLQEQDLANRYGVDLTADRHPWNEIGKEETGIIDPLEYAQKHREELGINVKDYMFPRTKDGLVDDAKILSKVESSAAKNTLRKRKNSNRRRA